ncbi:MAG: nuclear transport factor 2 family protein [Methanoregula sp.]|jgi:ketosteroid isomerase-like protein
MDETEQTTEVLAAIREMNRLWTETWDETAFRKFIHPDAVAMVPSAPGRMVGRDAYVAGWRGFAEAVKIHEWKETDHRVHFFCRGTCAVLTYFFTIRFTMGGHEIVTKGRDMFTLVKQGGRWLVAADQFSPEPGNP